MNTLHNLKRNLLTELDELEEVVNETDDSTFAFQVVAAVHDNAKEYSEAIVEFTSEFGTNDELKKELDWASYIVSVTTCCCERFKKDIAGYMKDLKN